MQWLHERRGETVIRLIPERRILVYVAAMMGGVAFTMNFGQRLASPVPVVVTTIGLGVAIWLGHRLAARWSHGWQGAEVGMVWFLAGCLSCLFQMSQMPAGLVDASSQARVTGVVEHVDGREDRRLRLWLRVGAVKDAPPDIAARILAQPVDTSREASALRLFDHVNGDSVAVVTGRSALSAGCGSSARFVLTTVRADYPCRDGRPLYSLAGLPSGNYLLYFRGADIRALRSDGQYFLISPVSRP